MDNFVNMDNFLMDNFPTIDNLLNGQLSSLFFKVIFLEDDDIASVKKGVLSIHRLDRSKDDERYKEVMRYVHIRITKSKKVFMDRFRDLSLEISCSFENL